MEGEEGSTFIVLCTTESSRLFHTVLTSRISLLSLDEKMKAQSLILAQGQTPSISQSGDSNSALPEFKPYMFPTTLNRVTSRRGSAWHTLNFQQRNEEAPSCYIQRLKGPESVGAFLKITQRISSRAWARTRPLNPKTSPRSS